MTSLSNTSEKKVPHAAHPFAQLSQFERDNLIATLTFVDHPNHIFLPEQLPFPNGFIINYSQFYASLDGNIRDGNYIAPEDLRNGDIVQFSEYRGCSSYYVLWLAKDLRCWTKKQAEKFHKEKIAESKYDFTAKKLKKTSLPIDFGVSFMPKPKQAFTTKEPIPLVFPRSYHGSHDDQQHECYFFSHLDEYGYSGSTITSMANETYFQQTKLERNSQIWLDPLLIHSKSYYGKLIQDLKTNEVQFRENPFFPLHYIGVCDVGIPSDPHQHALDIEWIPIDLAADELVTGGYNYPTHNVNAFYEIRNFLFLHFHRKFRNLLPAEASPSMEILPPLNTEFEVWNKKNRFLSFLIGHSARLRNNHEENRGFTPTFFPLPAVEEYVQAMTPQIYLDQLKIKYNPEDEEDGYDIFHPDLYNKLQQEVRSNWANLSSEEKQVYETQVAEDEEHAKTANEQLLLYSMYLKDKRAEFFSTHFPSHSTTSSDDTKTDEDGKDVASAPPVTSYWWFQFEELIARSWLNESAEVRAHYRQINEEQETVTQVLSDISTIIRSVQLDETMEKTLIAQLKGLPPIAAAAQVMVEAMTPADQHPTNRSTAPPAIPELPNLTASQRVIPKQLSFVKLPKASAPPTRRQVFGGFGMNMPGAYRPPNGFIQFVLTIYENEVENLHKEDERMRRSMLTNDFYRNIYRRWKLLSAEEVDSFAVKEAEANVKNEEFQTIRREIRNKAFPPPPPGSGFGFGFGGGFGRPPAAAPAVPAAAPGGFGSGFGAGAAIPTSGPSTGFGFSRPANIPPSSTGFTLPNLGAAPPAPANTMTFGSVIAAPLAPLAPLAPAALPPTSAVAQPEKKDDDVMES